jgi:hypothetical protein
MTIRRRIRCGRIRAELRDGKYYIPLEMDLKNSHAVPARSSEAPKQAINTPDPSKQVVKNRPTQFFIESDVPNRVPPVVHRAPQVHTPVNYAVAPAVAAKDVPETLVRPLVDAGLASVEARALIEFCDRALDQAKSTVQAVEHKYTARVEALNAELHSRNQEIKILNQQIEDLQLLVQILERKKIG